MSIALVFLAIVAVNAYPGGAPPKACTTMLPIHQGAPVQQTSSPFHVSSRPNGEGYMVTIQSSIGLPVQGFMLQARTPNQEIVGVFEPTTENLQTIDCQRPGDSLTHTSPANKQSVDVLWKPNGYEGPVVFNATVAQNFNTFWTGVLTPEVFVSKRSISNSNNTLTTPTARPSPTPPHFFPDAKQESSTDFDPFYDGCDTKKACFGSPAGCVKTKNCKAVVAVTAYGERYEFEMKASSSAAWIGVGLSDDDLMGDDSVIECVKEGGVVKAYMSTTVPRPNLNVIRDRKQDGIGLLQSSLDDGALYCRVFRETITKINNKEYNLARDKYHILVAAGGSINTNKVSFHDIAYLPSDQKRSLSDVTPIKAASKLLLRLHGAFMLTAWLGTASIGILLARYYRQTWVGSSLCGKDLWFAWHRFFMVLTWSLTMTGFVLIFVELRAWSSDRNPHAILGLVTTILCFLQPIGAYFRPHPGTSKRPIFNWVHWFGGNAAHIIAIVTIFFAVRLNKAELPEWMDWVLVGYVAFHVIMHIILSIMGCAAEKSSEKRVNAFPMKNMDGSGRSSMYTDRMNADAPFSTLRKFLLALYILVIILIVAALVCFVVLAPIEEFWESVMENM